MSLLAGKTGIVFGVANKRSIAWAIAQAWHKAGAKLAFTYQGERLKENVEELAGTFGWPEARTLFILANGHTLQPGLPGHDEDDAERGRAEMDLHNPGPADAVIAVTASGRTPFTLSAAASARQGGALVVALANNRDAPILAHADVPILLDTGPEIITRGWVHAPEAEPLLKEGAEAVTASLEAAFENDALDIETLQRHVRKAAGKFVNERTRRRPMIVPVVMEV